MITHVEAPKWRNMCNYLGLFKVIFCFPMENPPFGESIVDICYFFGGPLKKIQDSYVTMSTRSYGLRRRGRAATRLFSWRCFGVEGITCFNNSWVIIILIHLYITVYLAWCIINLISWHIDLGKSWCQFWKRLQPLGWFDDWNRLR